MSELEPKSGNESFNSAAEYAELGEKLKTETAVDAISNVDQKAGSDLIPYLVEPNVVLTLAGERGQTEFFIDSTDPKYEKAITAANEVLAEKGIYIHDGGVHIGANGKESRIVGVYSAEGLHKTSSETEIPGIEEFDASAGFDVERYKSWCFNSVEGVKAAQAEGRVPGGLGAEHIVVGVDKGYPDKAILGYAEHPDDYENMTSSNVEYADYYQCAEPNYDYPKSLESDPDIIGQQKRWGETLKSFYNSEWHKVKSATEEFKQTRAEIDKE